MIEFAYNSEMETLIIPEYGRHIQNLVWHARTIEDDEKRQATAEYIIDLMKQISPESRTNGEEYIEKYWKHLYRISEYQLKMTPPEGIDPNPVKHGDRDIELGYNQGKVRYRHYGKILRKMIDKACEEQDPQKQKEFAVILANQMKLAAANWNTDQFISDESIIADLKNISNGVLVLEEDTKLQRIATNNNNQKKRKNGGKNGHKNNKKRKSSNNSYRKNRYKK